MLVELAPRLLALRTRKLFVRSRASVSKTVLRRFLLGLASFGLLARGAQIDDLVHAWLMLGSCKTRPSALLAYGGRRRHEVGRHALAPTLDAVIAGLHVVLAIAAKEYGYTPAVERHTFV